MRRSHQAHILCLVAIAVVGSASTAITRSPDAARPAECESFSPAGQNRPILPARSSPADATFIDPTADIRTAANVWIGCQSYIGPFAMLDAGEGEIIIGNASNVQDNVVIIAEGLDADVEIGDHVILAHGVTVMGRAKIGAPGGKPAFVSFNAVVDGATVEQDAVVSALARVAPGVVIRAGRKVNAGRLVRTQAEADNPALGKVTDVTQADRAFMDGVLHVNESLAEGYTRLVEQSNDAWFGIGADPGGSDFNPTRDLPVLAGQTRNVVASRNRIIGRVTMADPFDVLTRVMGDRIAIRADEGEPFTIGSLTRGGVSDLAGRANRMGDRVTFHALEHSSIQVGDGVRLGFHVVVHGGEAAGNTPPSLTRIGNGVSVGEFSVVFRSTVGDNVTIGNYAIVDGSQLRSGMVVPDRAIVVNNAIVGSVEW